MNRLLLTLGIVVVLACPLSSWAQFETRGSTPIVTYPWAVATGDFNHDGKTDVAATAWLTGQVAVYLGRGNGTFEQPVYYNIDPQSESTYGIQAADLNHDGNIDLAVADFLGNNISILLGNGDGTFQPPMQFPTTGTPMSLAVGDFNNDGNADLVVYNSTTTAYISVLLGNGDGTFQPPMDNSSVYSCTEGPDSIAVGDFNRDNKLDVACSGEGAYVLLGNGDGTLQGAVSYPAGASLAVAVGDLNHDNNPDLVVSGYGVFVLLGNGDGTFKPAVAYPANSSGSVGIADVNGDGNLDVVVSTFSNANRGDQSFADVLLGNGDGSLQHSTSYPTGQDSVIWVADLNNDHQTDLLGADFGGSDIIVLLNTGVITFSPTTPLSFPPQLVGTASQPRHVTMTNNGAGTLSISSISTKQPFQLASDTTCGTSLPAGAKCTLSVAFQPTTATIGLQSGLVSVSDNASSKPQIIELSGTGTTLTVSPSQLNFGSQKVGTKSAPQTVTVTNTGTIAVRVTGVVLEGTDYYDYSQTNTCGKQIAPGASCTMSVTFVPQATGNRTAAIEINGPNGAEWQGIALTGSGT